MVILRKALSGSREARRSHRRVWIQGIWGTEASAVSATRRWPRRFGASTHPPSRPHTLAQCTPSRSTSLSASVPPLTGMMLWKPSQPLIEPKPLPPSVSLSLLSLAKALTSFAFVSVGNILLLRRNFFQSCVFFFSFFFL